MDEQLSVEQLANELGGESADNEQPSEDSQNDNRAQETSDDEDQDAEQSGDEEQTEQPDEDSAEQVEEWERNGEKISATKEELRKAFEAKESLRADYTQKTQNLAKERQDAQARIQQDYQQVQALAGEFGQLSTMDSQLAQYQQVDWAALRESDPLAYSTHMAERNNLRAMRGDLVAQIQGKQQYLEQQQQGSLQAAKAEALQHLKTLPGFTVDAIKQMEKHALSKGFTLQELSQKADKRDLEIMWEAAQYRALQDKKPAMQKKVAALPTKATKAAAPTGPQSSTQNIEKRLAKSGKVADFAALLSMTRK